MLKTAFGNNAMKKTVLYKWYSRFEQGKNSVTDEQRPGRPSFMSRKKIETVKELLGSGRPMTIGYITIRTGYTFGTVLRIIHSEHSELGMRNCARWIPHMIDEKAMQKKRPGMLQATILHHGNLSHRAAQTTETIKRLGFRPPLLPTRLGPLRFFFYFH